jgi:glycosyltransferase involved in cell wall biosynthesis
MRIGIDTHYLNGKPQGSRTYLLHLVRELARLAPDQPFYLYSFDPAQTRRLLEAPNLTHRRLFPRSARLRLPLVLPALEARDRLSVFHSQYISPPISLVAEVVSLHDILFESHPVLFEGAFSRASVWLIRRSARRAARVLTGSEFSRREILERYRLPEEKVVTIPDGVDTRRFRPLEGGALEEVRTRYRLEAPFLLSVGRLEPRKNLERVIRAFDGARRRLDRGLQLVLAGKEDFRFQGILREAERLPEGVVRLLGPVPDSDLPALYNLASGVVVASLVEGFGMPVLEAMACGIPVVASRRGALPEVGGEAALWVEPEDESALGSAMERLLTDQELRERLRREGLSRASGFLWETTASRTLEVYREAARL